MFVSSKSHVVIFIEGIKTISDCGKKLLYHFINSVVCSLEKKLLKNLDTVR